MASKRTSGTACWDSVLAHNFRVARDTTASARTQFNSLATGAPTAQPLQLPGAASVRRVDRRQVVRVILMDEQTTVGGRLDRAYGNSVLPRKRHVEFPDRIPFRSDESIARPHS